jgi:hypothetical protein
LLRVNSIANSMAYSRGIGLFIRETDMPSSLIGLRRKLTWSEFIGKPTAQELQKMQQIAAGATGTVGMAATKSNFTVNFGGQTPADPVLTLVPGSSQSFILGNDIVVTVIFDAAGSWKRIGPLTATGEQLLLDHEQGHYDITSLMARDCFIDLMQLKANTYSSVQDGQKAARDIVKSYKDKLNPVQDKYDDDTTHGAWVTPSMGPERKETFQNKWEMFIKRALTQDRTPEMTAPDGASYKVRLLEVLATGGFTF